MAAVSQQKVDIDHVSGQANDGKLTRPTHALTSTDVADELKTNVETGLTDEEAASRLIEYGRNNLGEQKGVSKLAILIAQVANSMLVVLIMALVACFAIQAWWEGGFLAVIILINIVIGYVQELQAANSIADLTSLSAPTARVLRGGENKTIDSEMLVPGDVIVVKTGDSVPADARLLESINLEANEASLTGESVPARKAAADVLEDPDVGPGDRTNVVFTSSTVTKGRGRAVVFATGLCAETGLIAASLRGSNEKRRVVRRDEQGRASVWGYVVFGGQVVWDDVLDFLGLTKGTPLQRKLSALFLIVLGIAVCCAIIVLGVNKFQRRNDIIIYAVATALGTLPVTLVLVLVITEAAGAKAMVKRNVVVRNMASLEALGGVTDICSDKTGTLTQGRMVGRMAWIPSLGTYSIGAVNEAWNPKDGAVTFSRSEPIALDPSSEDAAGADATNFPDPNHDPNHDRFLDIAAFANLATINQDEKGAWQADGDPTEVAIRVFAARFGRGSLQDSEEWTQLAEFPFDSSVKKMSVLCHDLATDRARLFTKGAVERVLGSCTWVSSGCGSIRTMTSDYQARILENMEALARRGLRVLALADSTTCSHPSEDEVRHGRLNRDEFERDLVFRGLIGIFDPPRLESRPSVFKCHQAGIAVHMLTGDHPETAKAIAIDVGILPARMELVRADIAKSLVMTAHELDRLSDTEIDQLPKLPLVVARCSPTTKVRMIDALHRRGRYVAMTGDGVNDGPSLKRADIGIAMGGGSDVAKSVSDIVLSDGNFASILNAVEEGRRIFDNIQKFMLHVLAANVGFVTTLLAGLAYRGPDGASVFQVSPVQILVMLLVAGAFSETGLGFERASPDILLRPPQSLKRGVFTLEFLIDLIAYGIFMAISLLVSFAAVLFGIHSGHIGDGCNLRYSPECEDVFRARSSCYASMMFIFVLFAWELVDSRRSFFDGIISNTRGWWSRVWGNKFLFWSVVAGFGCVFLTLWLPWVDHNIFLHTGIDVEWGVVFGTTIFFVLGAEGWKWAKRFYLRRKGLMLGKQASLEEEDIERRVFSDMFGEDGGVVASEK